MERFMNLFEMFISDVRVHLSGRDVGVAEERLYRSEICTIFEEVGCE